mmetsp:Transcript_3021/g.7048  ORF Transcript_3021/g.7048 Transcript_3021/m.7048 type:complete len:207 (+) Transcript_3021:194-814(+)
MRESSPFFWRASRIKFLISGSLVSSAGVLPFRSKQTVLAPCFRSMHVASLFSLNAAKCNGYCRLMFGMSGSPPATNKASRTSTYPRRLARHIAVAPRYPRALTSTPALSNISMHLTCPFSAAHTIGGLPPSSAVALSSSKAKADSASISPSTAAFPAALDGGLGGGNFTRGPALAPGISKCFHRSCGSRYRPLTTMSAPPSVPPSS